VEHFVPWGGTTRSMGWNNRKHATSSGSSGIPMIKEQYGFELK